MEHTEMQKKTRRKCTHTVFERGEKRDMAEEANDCRSLGSMIIFITTVATVLHSLILF